MADKKNPTQKRRLCSVISMANGEDPIGSAVQFDQYLILEVPPPWPRDVWEAKHLPTGLMAVIQKAVDAGLRVRPQAVLPDDTYSQPGLAHVIHYKRPSELFAHYEKTEFLVPQDERVSLVEALLIQPEKLAAYADYQQHPEPVREILVCTHSARDACCAKFGLPIYKHLRELSAASVEENGDLRVWRSSHLGGHRFAATLVDLPSGQYWGHLDQETVQDVLHRRKEAKTLKAYYRGWGGLGKFEQIVEREILMQEGWPWLDYHKAGQVTQVNEDETQASVKLNFTSTDSHISGHYEATVEEVKRVKTLSSSGFEPDKEVPVYQVNHLTKVLN